ncbi:HNH endonuclease signature motif containing protein [Bacillus toyonensis]|uniref:HNH endonuclease signature motif containing protein n=1 Tax=Bacillus toyonensis TaxID=155322 RepID=UPI00124BDC18|nr:HNH endonuclease signature motif containing protein [Bacillus toyonensis]KAB2380215.1 HNH endonuclease [Bacillus toyonensis]
MKQINGSDYYVTENGLFFNSNLNIVQTSLNGSGYETVRVGRGKTEMAHRVVAEMFVDGVGEVVHHKDNNKTNNHFSNLEWTTQRQNLVYSYKTMTPVRNFRECRLLYKGEEIGVFKSIKEASRVYAQETGGSQSSMEKYRKVGDYELEQVLLH